MPDPLQLTATGKSPLSWGCNGRFADDQLRLDFVEARFVGNFFVQDLEQQINAEQFWQDDDGQDDFFQGLESSRDSTKLGGFYLMAEFKVCPFGLHKAWDFMRFSGCFRA